MIAFANTWRRDPWAITPSDREQMPVAQVVEAADLYVRNFAAIAAVKASMGISATDPGLERQLKELELWPADAAPLPIDVSLVLGRLTKIRRTYVYARLLGLSITEAAKAMGKTAPYGHVHLGGAAGQLCLAARCFGIVPSHSNPDQIVGDHCLREALNIPAFQFYAVVAKAGVSRKNPRYGVGGYHQDDMPALWWAATDARMARP